MVTFEEFLAARLPALVRYAAVLTADCDLAQDVVQDALVRAHARWRRIGAMDRPELYVHRMIMTGYLSWRRRTARRAAMLADHQPVTVDPDHAHGHAERSALWSRMAALPTRQRAVLVLRYYEGLADVEIAEVLGCATGSVRVLRNRALTTLRLDDSLKEAQ